MLHARTHTRTRTHTHTHKEMNYCLLRGPSEIHKDSREKLQSFYLKAGDACSSFYCGMPCQHTYNIRDSLLRTFALLTCHTFCRLSSWCTL